MRRGTPSSPTGHFDNPHSRWVAWLKVALPLAALAILSTLFLVADRRGSGDAIPYSDVQLDRIVNEGRIANPSYAGVAPGGAAVTLSADEAWPEDASRETMLASNVIGAWETSDGARVALSSDAARLTGGGGRALLEGDVSIRDAQGYRLRSEALEIDLETADVVSPGPVSGTSPVGEIAAGSMRVVQKEGEPRLTFSDGVKLIYDPATPDGE